MWFKTLIKAVKIVQLLHARTRMVCSSSHLVLRFLVPNLATSESSLFRMCVCPVRGFVFRCFLVLTGQFMTSTLHIRNYRCLKNVHTNSLHILPVPLNGLCVPCTVLNLRTTHRVQHCSVNAFREPLFTVTPFLTQARF